MRSPVVLGVPSRVVDGCRLSAWTCLLVALAAAPASVRAAGVVGSGTPASCTSNALATALAGGGTVTFSCGAAPVTILADTQVIESGVDATVDGGGLVTLDGEDLRQIFYVLAGGQLLLRDLVLVNGSASSGDGGAILNQGTLRLERVHIEASTAQGVGRGGAIANQGMLAISQSLLIGNEALGSGSQGGAIANLGGSLDVLNSTLVGNRAASGGALYNAAMATLRSATLVDNQADLGGTLYDALGEPVTARNTILAGSLALDGTTSSLACDGTAGPITSLGYNLVDDGSCVLTGPGDQERTDPLLGPLQDNGGPTLTFAPLAGSPAVDQGSPAGCPATDQRGVSRPRDGDGVGGARCDIGAVEVPEPGGLAAAIAALAALGLARAAKGPILQRARCPIYTR